MSVTPDRVNERAERANSEELTDLCAKLASPPEENPLQMLIAKSQKRLSELTSSLISRGTGEKVMCEQLTGGFEVPSD